MHNTEGWKKNLGEKILFDTFSFPPRPSLHFAKNCDDAVAKISKILYIHLIYKNIFKKAIIFFHTTSGVTTRAYNFEILQD